MSFLCAAGTKKGRIAQMSGLCARCERLFGGDFNHSVHFGQNIISEMAFDLVTIGQFRIVGTFGLT